MTMKTVILSEPIIWSRTVNVLSVLTALFLLGILIWMPMSAYHRMMLFCLEAIVFISSLYYAPMSLTLTSRVLGVRRLLTTRRINVSDIVSVRACAPSSMGWRVCGSGGFLGYWGWWRSAAEGTYFAYVGRYDEAFLIELKSGRKYMLSCRDSASMIEAVNRLISNLN